MNNFIQKNLVTYSKLLITSFNSSSSVFSFFSFNYCKNTLIYSLVSSNFFFISVFISCIYWYGRWVLRVHSRTGSGVCPCAFFNWVGFIAVEFPVSKKRCGSIWYNNTRFWSEFGCFSGIWWGNLYLSFSGWVASSWESLSLCLKYYMWIHLVDAAELELFLKFGVALWK